MMQLRRGSHVGSNPAAPIPRADHRGKWGIVLAGALAASVAGCAASGGTERALTADRQVELEGRISSVDTSPMAYDGNALVVLHTATHGAVTVHLPARVNLCKAQGMGLLAELEAGDRLRVSGTATGPRDITVCESVSHRLQRID